MYTKERIIEEIRRVAKKLGTKTLKRKDFEAYSTIPTHTLGYYLGSWSDAVKEAGLEDIELEAPGSKKEAVDEDVLLLDLIRLYEEYKKEPTVELVTIEGKFDPKLYDEMWKSLENAFLKAKAKFPERFTEKKREEHDESVEFKPADEVEENQAEVDLGKEQAGPDEPINFSDLKFEQIEVDEEIKEEEDKNIDTNEKPKGGGLDPTIPQGSPDYDNVSYDHVDFNEETQEQEIKDIPNIPESAEPTEPEKPQEEPEEPIELTDEEIDEDTLNQEIEEISSEEEIVEIKKMPTASEEDINFIEAKEDRKESSDYIYDQREKLTPLTIKPKKEKKRRKVMGEMVNFRGIRFAPVNRLGVAYLFGMVSRELDFIIESFQLDYPDCEGRRCFDKEKNQWEYVRISFEYKSTDFKEKNRDENDCDILVCWVHDWEECPMEVLELRSTIISE